MTTCVVGLGKIGLPLAVQIASKGENVIGCDINKEVVDLIDVDGALVCRRDHLRRPVVGGGKHALQHQVGEARVGG